MDFRENFESTCEVEEEEPTIALSCARGELKLQQL